MNEPTPIPRRMPTALEDRVSQLEVRLTSMAGTCQEIIHRITVLEDVLRRFAQQQRSRP